MLTAMDLCGPVFTPHAAHHSAAPHAAPIVRLTRVIYIREQSWVRMDRACTTVTGPLIALIETPVEDAYTPVKLPITDAPSFSGPSIFVPVVERPRWWAPFRTPSVSAVPEPTVWALMMLGVGMIGARLRKKQTRVA